MSYNIKRRVYESAPLWLKRSVCSLSFDRLAGKEYREVLSRDSFFRNATQSEIRKYQEKILGKVLDYVVNQVPAYQTFQSLVERFSPFEAIREFPLLEKSELQENLEHYLPKNFKNIPHYAISTGGTTGNQLKFYVDNKSQSIEMGFVHRLWKIMGYTPRCRKATFRGVSFKNLKADCFWQHNPIYNELQFSPFHISEKNLPRYIEELIKYNPKYFHGYPSTIDSLAEYVLRQNMTADMPSINAVFLVSEGCSSFQRRRIEKAFSTRVFSFYGHSERVIIAGECEKNETYHHVPDYGYLEIVDEKGNYCHSEGQRGELIGTGFLNRSLPLVRYKTGDYAIRCESRCECGREWERFRNVEGRWKQDVVVGKNGAKISIASLNMHGPLFEKVARYQYVQKEKGTLFIRLMVGPGFTENDRLLIEREYQNKVSEELKIKAKLVDNIPLTSRGKLKVLESSL